MLTFFDGTRRPPAAAATFAGNAAAYVKLLGHHIREEDAELWPLASRVLTENDDASLIENFAEAEHKTLGDGGEASYREQAGQIAQRVGL
jgi:hemerythrin-like domain-containing protein